MEIKPAKRAGEILALLRGHAEMTQQQVADKAHCHTTNISHLENGTKAFHPDFVKQYGAAIGYEKVAAAVWGFVSELGFSAAAEILAAFETEAVRISVLTTQVFHPLLQTEAYARAVLEATLPFASEAEREKRLVKGNERRQAIERDNPPFVWAVVDESALYRPLGGPEVMRDQLLHVESLAKSSNVVIQVLPFTAWRQPGIEGDLGIIEFADKAPVWYTDAWGAGSLSDDPAQVVAKRTDFDVIRSAAISRGESVDFFGRTRKERYELQQ